MYRIVLSTFASYALSYQCQYAGDLQPAALRRKRLNLRLFRGHVVPRQAGQSEYAAACHDVWLSRVWLSRLTRHSHWVGSRIPFYSYPACLLLCFPLLSAPLLLCFCSFSRLCAVCGECISRLLTEPQNVRSPPWRYYIPPAETHEIVYRYQDLLRERHNCVQGC
jgi:hypothetical protein